MLPALLCSLVLNAVLNFTWCDRSIFQFQRLLQILKLPDNDCFNEKRNSFKFVPENGLPSHVPWGREICICRLWRWWIYWSSLRYRLRKCLHVANLSKKSSIPIKKLKVDTSLECYERITGITTWRLFFLAFFMLRTFSLDCPIDWRSSFLLYHVRWYLCVVYTNNSFPWIKIYFFYSQGTHWCPFSTQNYIFICM